MYKLELGVFMYKHHTNQLPSIFYNCFVKPAQIHRYSTRNAHDYSINKNKMMFSNRSVRNSGPTLWNSLEKNTKVCKTTKQFKNQFKSTLKAKYDE
jgi:hypothetical protein